MKNHLLLLLIPFALSSCKKDKKVSYQFDEDSIIIHVGETRSILARSSAEGDAGADIEYVCSDSKVLQNTSRTSWKGIKPGVVQLTARRDGVLFDEVSVTVMRPRIGLISFIDPRYTMTVGEQQILEVDRSDSELAAHGATWISTNEEVLTINGKTVTAVGQGTALISISNAEGKQLVGIQITVN